MSEPITSVGAWAQYAQTTDPEASVEIALQANVTTVSIMVNDYSKDRDDRPFETRDVATIQRFADLLHQAGIEVTLTSWIMPYADFITEAANQLIPLCASTRAVELIWDAEEPWTQANDPMDYDAAAQLMADQFAPLGPAGTTLAVSGIAWVSSTLAGLAAACPRWYPQCYATTNEGSGGPTTVVNNGINQWRSKFGDSGEFTIGLAAYAQPTPPSEYMQPCLDQVYAAAIPRVCYWDLGAIGARADVSQFVSTVLGSDGEPVTPMTTPGIMATLDIGAMPSGTYDKRVELVQRLLPAYGFDPGTVDGKPGKNTLAAVEAFQSSRGLTPDGIVGGATWWWLLVG